MKITHVEAYEVFIPAADPPFVWRRGLLGSEATQGGLLRIGTDEGAEGLALSTRPGSGPVLKDLVDRVLRRDMVGQDPFNRELLWHRMWELDRTQEIALYLLGLPDVALWDLAGEVYSEPVWRLLGGARTELPAYASTTTFASVEQFLDVADQCLRLGYPAIKLHAFGDAREHADLCRRLREHVGDEVPFDVTTVPRASTCPTPSTGDEPSMRPVTSGTRSRSASSASPPTNGWPSGFVCRCWSARPPMGRT